ncbi:hypothetical protein NK918_24280, partial [Salmonella enterica subsp. enterica serovar Typhimurium]|uniref:hypothetical protein n=1 Tax=Salmonella enterica TaxID=28901 RepID=UPI0020A35452
QRDDEKDAKRQLFAEAEIAQTEVPGLVHIQQPFLKGYWSDFSNLCYCFYHICQNISCLGRPAAWMVGKFGSALEQRDDVLVLDLVEVAV